MIEYLMVLVKELSPRMVMMDEGKLAADGLTLDVLDDEALLSAGWRSHEICKT